MIIIILLSGITVFLLFLGVVIPPLRGEVVREQDSENPEGRTVSEGFIMCSGGRRGVFHQNTQLSPPPPKKRKGKEREKERERERETERESSRYSGREGQCHYGISHQLADKEPPLSCGQPSWLSAIEPHLGHSHLFLNSLFHVVMVIFLTCISHMVRFGAGDSLASSPGLLFPPLLLEEGLGTRLVTRELHP